MGKHNIKQAFNDLKSYARSAYRFITHDVWDISLHTVSRSKAILVVHLRVILMVLRGFKHDNCYIKASALTFYTLLSIVPVVAMLFGIARGFGIEKMLESNLKDALVGQEEVANRIVEFSNSLLQNTKSGVIVGVGILVLFWTVIKLFGNIENSFNDIWGIKEGRSLVRKVSDYLSMVFLCPIILVFTTSSSVLLSNQVFVYFESLPVIGRFPIIKLVSFAMIWLLFTIIYMFLPNTRVRFSAGVAGGVIGGSLFIITQWAYVTFQFFTAKYNAIYGSFAALPLFLMWLQLSWVIVLVGAEIAYAVQNVENYDAQPLDTTIPFSLKKLLALHITKICIDSFQDGKPAQTAEQIANITDIPARIVRVILYELVSIGVLCEVRTTVDQEPSFKPAQNVERLTIHHILTLLEDFGDHSIQFKENEYTEKLKGYLAKMQQITKTSDTNRPLAAI